VQVLFQSFSAEVLGPIALLLDLCGRAVTFRGQCPNGGRNIELAKHSSGCDPKSCSAAFLASQVHIDMRDELLGPDSAPTSCECNLLLRPRRVDGGKATAERTGDGTQSDVDPETGGTTK